MMDYRDWALAISAQNPNFNRAVFSGGIQPDDYNYRLGYLDDPSGVLAGNGHLSDIGKLPNHPTYSTESAYAIGDPNAGRWVEPVQEAAPWLYHNPSRGLYYANEQDAYRQKDLGR